MAVNIVAIILSAVGLNQYKKNQVLFTRGSRNMAVAGLVMGCVGVGIVVILLVTAVSLLNSGFIHFTTTVSP